MPMELTSGSSSPRRSWKDATGGCCQSAVTAAVAASKSAITNRMAASTMRLRAAEAPTAASQAQAVAQSAMATMTTPARWRKSASSAKALAMIAKKTSMTTAIVRGAMARPLSRRNARPDHQKSDDGQRRCR